MLQQLQQQQQQQHREETLASLDTYVMRQQHWQKLPKKRAAGRKGCVLEPKEPRKAKETGKK